MSSADESYQKHGGPAFPAESVDGVNYLGMTLRDWFAGHAMQPIMADAMRVPLSSGSPSMSDVARKAYILADAMIEARKVIPWDKPPEDKA